MGSDHLLWRQATSLTRTANARAENEDGLPRDDGRYQLWDKFDGIAAIAIKKDQDFRVIADCGYAGLDGAPVAALRLDNDAGAGGSCLLRRSVARAAIHDNDFAHILGEHRGHDPRDCRFLIEAWDDRRDNGFTMGGGPRTTVLVLDVVHRLQRSPQLAQAARGLSESSALRKSRYADPFQISRKVCCVALPNV